MGNFHGGNCESEQDHKNLHTQLMFYKTSVKGYKFFTICPNSATVTVQAWPPSTILCNNIEFVLSTYFVDDLYLPVKVYTEPLPHPTPPLGCVCVCVLPTPHQRVLLMFLWIPAQLQEKCLLNVPLHSTQGVLVLMDYGA